MKTKNLARFIIVILLMTWGANTIRAHEPEANQNHPDYKVQQPETPTVQQPETHKAEMPTVQQPETHNETHKDQQPETHKAEMDTVQQQ